MRNSTDKSEDIVINESMDISIKNSKDASIEKSTEGTITVMRTQESTYNGNWLIFMNHIFIEILYDR